MKYIVIDEQRNGCGDAFTKEFEKMDDAIKEAKDQWYYLTAAEKKKRIVYVLESENPDEDADNHFDGNYVWHCEGETNENG